MNLWPASRRAVRTRFAWRTGPCLLIALLAVSMTPTATGSEPLDPTVVYSWPHSAVDVENKTALAQWAVEVAPVPIEAAAVQGRTRFAVAPAASNGATLMMTDTELGRHAWTVNATPITKYSARFCHGSDGEEPACINQGPRLHFEVARADQPSYLIVWGTALDWFPAAGAYPLGADVIGAVREWLIAVGVRDVASLEVIRETPIEGPMTMQWLVEKEPRADITCPCTSYWISTPGARQHLDTVHVIADDSGDLMRINVNPRLDWQQTLMLSDDALEAALQSFASNWNLSVDEVRNWGLDSETGGLNRTVKFLQLDAGDLWVVDGVQRAYDGAVLLGERRMEIQNVNGSPFWALLVVVVFAFALVRFGRR